MSERDTLAALLHDLYCEPMGFVNAHVGTTGDGGCKGRADRLIAAGVRLAPADTGLREALAFIADWAHDCEEPAAAIYGFADIEAKARAALAAQPEERP